MMRATRTFLKYERSLLEGRCNATFQNLVILIETCIHIKFPMQKLIYPHVPGVFLLSLLSLVPIRWYSPGIYQDPGGRI